MTDDEAIYVLNEMLVKVKAWSEKTDILFKEKQALELAIRTLKKEKPQGKWDFIGYNLFKCTTCSYAADANWLRDWKQNTYDSEFPMACPNCGSKMR